MVFVSFPWLSFWEGGDDTSPLTVPGKRAVKNFFRKEKYAVSSVIDKNQCFVYMTGPKPRQWSTQNVSELRRLG